MNHTAALDSTTKVRTSISNKSINQITLMIFAPLLILVGVAGFLIPARYSATSGAAAYNIFHIFFGTVGLLFLWSGKELLVSSFNLDFGLIDLYQAFASYQGLPPKEYFLWTRADDILHIVIGLTLVIIGFYGVLNTRRKNDERKSLRS